MASQSTARAFRSIQKPLPEGEYSPYAIQYVRLVADDGLVLQHMADQAAATSKLMSDLPEELVSTPCAEGEWTIKQIMAHIIDAERIFGYRALRIARNDLRPLYGYDQDDDMLAINAGDRSTADLLEEYNSLRAATLIMFNTLPEEAFARAGTASDNPLTVRGALYIIAGHELYHLESIQENYLQGR